MKKYLYTLLFVAVALFSAATMSSCGDDEQETPEIPVIYTQNYARYTAKISEGIFDYFDVNVTIVIDGKEKVYTLGENTKVADTGLDPSEKIAGRVLEIPVFQFNATPLRFVTDFKLTDAGKAKIAEATSEEIDFIVDLDYGLCNEKGTLEFDGDLHVEHLIYDKGAHVKELETFIGVIKENHKKALDHTFK